ncbi:MAG: vanillate O-demethylase oxidoreductase VanB, partial [Chloroflexi bacterium]
MNTTIADRIEKEIVLKAPRSRVWRAISDPAEFGAWFKVDMSGVTFEAGEPVKAKMTYPGYEGMPFEMVIERIEP